MIHYPSFRGLERREMLELRIAEGKGITGDVVRIVTYFLDAKTFEVVFKIDPEEDLA